MSSRKLWTASALGRVTRMWLSIRHWLHCCLTRYVSMLHHHHASYPTLIYPYPSHTHILCSALVSLRVDVFTIQTSVVSLPCRSVYRSATLSTAVQFHVFLHNAHELDVNASSESTYTCCTSASRACLWHLRLQVMHSCLQMSQQLCMRGCWDICKQPCIGCNLKCHNYLSMQTPSTNIQSSNFV